MKKIYVLFILLIFCGSLVWAEVRGDVNGDNKVGLAEAVHALQITAGIKPETIIPGAIVPVVKTGQTLIHAAGDDGSLQNGIEPPTLRFTDNNDGTVTDNMTGLIWLRNANCFDQKLWSEALSDCNSLANGICGLTDGSSPGDWHLANIKELQSLIDFGNTSPALPSDHLFTDIQPGWYWSGTPCAGLTDDVWVVNMASGFTGYFNKPSSIHVWPVRGGSE